MVDRLLIELYDWKLLLQVPNDVNIIKINTYKIEMQTDRKTLRLRLGVVINYLRAGGPLINGKVSVRNL